MLIRTVPPPADVALPSLPRGAVVLQVLPSLASGGVERGTVEMVDAVVRAGGRALVASAGGPMARLVEHAGGEHVWLDLMTKDPLSVWRNAGRLASLVRAEGVSLLHARSRAPAWSGWLAARRTGVAFVTTWHGVHGEDFPGKRQYNAVLARGDRVIAISGFVARQVAARHGVGADRLRVIPRGVDVAAFDPAVVSGERVHRLASAWGLPDGARVVMLPARLVRWKGHAVLLDAVARLGREDVCVVLVGAGDPRGRYEAELVAEAARLGVGARLRFAGQCDDMPAALMLADAVVSASLRPEPFGRVVIEAQAMGRAVVAGEGGGAAETIEPGVTGWRVPAGDAGALAATLAVVLGLGEGERAALGAQARAAVIAGFTAGRMQAATLAVYNELLG
ncbi:MAG: glycosyltransferase family 4 protein [Janthinobacterium lividum]